MADFTWNLRVLMAERGMFQTSDLRPRLAQLGVSLSREQVYRLVVHSPQRLNMDVLVALCEILDCDPSALITPVRASRSSKRAVNATPSAILPVGDSRPPRTTLRDVTDR